MSKIQDMWDGTIEVLTDAGRVYVSCTERWSNGQTKNTYMKLDGDLARELVKELEKTITEAEDA